MSDNLQLWMESAFNVAYLIAVWTLVVMMYRRYRLMPVDQRRLQGLFLTIFALLALGDTGHVGFRVVAFASGDMNMMIDVFGIPTTLLGLGSLSTSITVTFFYMLLVLIWQTRFDRKLDGFAWFLLLAGVARLIIMAFPQNEWGAVTAPHTWVLLRNAPLMVLGLGVTYRILRDAAAKKDKVFKQVGIWILVSYAFFTPVILLAYKIPVIGVLMIPKTLAYLVIAIIGYRNLFQKELQVA